MDKFKETEPEELVVGVAWYQNKQWQRLRAISADSDGLEDTYDEWLRSAEQKFAELVGSGLRVEKVDIDSERLIAWCNERGFEINGQSRSSYVAHKLRERDSGFK